MEGAHGELCTWFTDGLSRNDTNCLTVIDAVPTSEVAPITGRAHAIASLAGNHRPYANIVDTMLLEQCDRVLVQQGSGSHDQFLAGRIKHVLGNDPSQYAFRQGLDNVTTFDERRHQQPFGGAAILLGDHQILGNVHEPAGQVSRVSGFQRGIGQAFSGAMRGNEVLQYVQAFAEIRGDRRFDDGSIRLGHQTAHTGQLTDLGCGTTGAGIGHHEDRVEGLLLGNRAIRLDDVFRTQAIHHDLGHLIVGM